MLFKSLVCCAVLFAPAGPLAAGDTVAVLSSASGVYLEAFSKFQAGSVDKIPYFDISREKLLLPPGTRTVVAFGSKAARQTYPPAINLVYLLAPGYFVDGGKRSGATVKVSMLTPAERLLTGLKELQPKLKKLIVFWRSSAYADLLGDYPSALTGVEVRTVQVKRADQLPGLLRSVIGSADAFWLPPDPLLISQESIKIFRDFSLSNAIPMYVSTKGLAQKGACAAIGVSFAEMGAEASAAVKKLSKGISLPRVIYPANSQLTINVSAAKRCRLSFSSEVTAKAASLLP